MFERQNHPIALTYLKAYAYCERKDRVISVSIIGVSLLFFLAGIFNKYLPQIFADNSEKFLDGQNTSAQIINILSGIFLISQIFINTVARQANRDSACFLSMYECYVYDIPLNNSMLPSYTQNETEAFARKMKRHSEHYKNFLFKTPDEAKGKFAIFEKQYQIVNDQNRLMNYSKPFFMVLWIGFIVLVIGLAMSFDDKFVSTLTNMLIPSLSIINLIVRNAHIFNESNNRLKNAIKTMNDKRENCKKSWTASEQQDFLVDAEKFSQDTIFMLRLLEFTVPTFLEKRSKKYHSKPIHLESETAAENEKPPFAENEPAKHIAPKSAKPAVKKTAHAPKEKPAQKK